MTLLVVICRKSVYFKDKYVTLLAICGRDELAAKKFTKTKMHVTVLLEERSSSFRGEHIIWKDELFGGQ